MLSVITPLPPSHIPYLQDTYESLLRQSFKDWEWVIGLNGGAELPEYLRGDPRVVSFFAGDDPDGKNKVGRLKKACCLRASGKILVELDADDLLTPNALETIQEAFDSKTDGVIVMAYSNCAEFWDKTWKPRVFSEYWGWRSRPFRYADHDLVEMVAWPPNPQSFRRVEWAPDHVRAWHREAYIEIGGHDESLRFGDDHDLCCRMFVAFGADRIKYIDECLYVYRLHGSNNCVTKNDEVQAQVWLNQLKYTEPMAMRWATDGGLLCLDLGGGINPQAGYITVDRNGGDVGADLDGIWPFKDDSVGVVRASHIFEHLHDPVHVMNEAYRILAPGGFLFIDVPSADGRGAFQDPTHVSYWNRNSFWYYTNRDYARFVPKYNGRFQVSRITEYYPDEFFREHDILCVRADLICLKPPYDERPVGEVLI